MWPVVKLLRNVFCSSIASRSRRVMKSASPTPIALPFEDVCQRQGGDDMDDRLGEVFAVAAAAVADDVRVHAGAAERFADRVDDQHVDVVERQSRKVVAMPLDQFGLAPQNIAWPHGVQFGRLIEAVFQNRQAGPDLARVEHHLAHLEQHVFHLRRGRRVKRRGRRAFCPCRRPSFS